jgi:hypothetical protein
MIKNWRRKLAARLAPEMAREASMSKELSDKLWQSQCEVRDLMCNDDRRVNGLTERLATAATSIANHMKDAAVLRNALLVTKPYVFDAFVEMEEQLQKLTPKSKKRAAIIATLEAIQSDLRKIDAALAPAKENGKPVTLTAEVVS